MKINAITLVILITIGFFLMQCDFFVMDRRYGVRMENNSPRLIAGYAAIANSDTPTYPDVTLPLSNKYLENVSSGRVATIYEGSLSWDRMFQLLPSDTLSLFVFSGDSLSRYPWQEIRNRYNILARYDMSLQDLKALDFKVPYPPDQRMQNMKIFP